MLGVLAAGCGCITILGVTLLGIVYLMVQQIQSDGPSGDRTGPLAIAYDKDGKPQPPFSVRPKPLPNPQLGDRNLAEMSAEELRQLARRMHVNALWQEAVQAQQWAVHQERRALYDLACMHCRNGQFDAAVYWLQEAALEEGVDVAWAEQDEDLEQLRKSYRWATVRSYLQAAAKYWRKHGEPARVLLLPRGRRDPGTLDLLVCLHGDGGNPKEFVADFQSLADALGIAVLGISATTPTGPQHYRWSEDAEENHARVEAALVKAFEKAKLAKTGIVLLGFSRGGQTAVELAVRAPRRFAGAIAFSPRASPDSNGESAPKDLEGEAAKGQRYVLVHGQTETPQIVANARRLRDWLEQAGAIVHVQEDRFRSAHILPRNAAAQLPLWVRFVQGKENRLKGKRRRRGRR